jgi:hypothetical protein
MKKLLPFLLLLASCDSRKGDGDQTGDAPAEPSAAALPSMPGAEDLAALQARVSRAMAAALPDAGTAQYRGLRAGAGGAACGEVATTGKTLSGIFRPFVVTPDGLAIVASGPAIAWEDPDDFVADAWIRWCATPEELQRLGPQLQSAAVNSATAAEPLPEGPDLPLPPIREDAPGADPPPPPAPPPAPARKSDAPPPRIDSFFNSVDREP